LPDSRKVRPGAFPARRPLYYYVTDRRRLRPRDFQARVRQLIRWGIDFIQIREKDLADRELFLLVSRVVASARRTPCRVLVNGRADVALAAGAHGVHLPSTGLRIDDIRPWLPGGFLVGVSVHSRSEAVQAWSSGADYLLIGPIFPTPSKAGMGSPLGLAAFQGICSEISIPVIGLGGIGAESVKAVLQAGASGVAAIRLFQESSAIRPGTRREFGIR
jgi:thiamine-phosphate pyrophosphorylase